MIERNLTDPKTPGFFQIFSSGRRKSVGTVIFSFSFNFKIFWAKIAKH